MWYFSWILGVGLAVAVGVLNGMWYEFNSKDDPEADDLA
jgi:cytochrome bd-I ubiquinol oxidase subunit X